MMTDFELETRIQKLIRLERKITAEILKLINLAEERKLPLSRGHGDTMSWLIALGCSEPAARRRMAAAKLARAVPGAVEKLESGTVSLSTLAKAQSAIRLQEKVTGERLDDAAKANVVSVIESKTFSETEKALFVALPATVSSVKQEHRRAIDAETVRLGLNLSAETLADLDRVKDLLSHVNANGMSVGEVVAFLATEFLSRKDPLRKKVKPRSSRVVSRSATASVHRRVTAAENAAPLPRNEGSSGSTSAPTTWIASGPRASTAIPAALRRAVLQRDHGRCTFRDHASGRVCGSTYQIEIDHVRPRALGGDDSAENLRCLCRRHNQLMAERNLGKEKAHAWRNTR